MVLNLLVLLPFRPASLTQQSLRLLIDRHLSLQPLLLHPLTPRALLLPPLLLFRSLSCLQSSSLIPIPNPYRLLPMRRPPPHHDPLRYLHNAVRVSLTLPAFPLVLCAKVKMAKTVVLVSVVVGRKLVLVFLALVPRLRLCLVQD